MDTTDYVTLSQAARLLPGRPHLSTLHRWRLSGIRGIRLKTALVGGRRFTTCTWLEEFIEQTTTAANGDHPKLRTLKQRQRAIEQADRELAADGW